MRSTTEYGTYGGSDDVTLVTAPWWMPPAKPVPDLVPASSAIATRVLAGEDETLEPCIASMPVSAAMPRHRWRYASLFLVGALLGGAIPLVLYVAPPPQAFRATTQTLIAKLRRDVPPADVAPPSEPSLEALTALPAPPAHVPSATTAPAPTAITTHADARRRKKLPAITPEAAPPLDAVAIFNAALQRSDLDQRSDRQARRATW
jgi:hypothetical protein